MAIRFFDMFSGIGGFRSGLEAVGGFECIGHCEIDPYPNTAYNAIFETRGEYYCDDARKINPDNIPDFDLVCAGFPCQSFSVAGKRLGFEDTRGTLFFEVARLLKAKRPASRYYVPQQRKRLYIVGYLDERCAGEIFPLESRDAKNLRQIIGGSQGQRVYDPDGIACTQCAGSGGQGGKTGLYFIDLNPDPKITDEARTIIARHNAGVTNHKGVNSGVLIEDKPRAIISPQKETVRQNGRRVKEPDEPMFTITATDRHGVVHEGRIRTLMPIECWRLQGFTDEQFYKAQAMGLSDARLYKMAGNSVTVPVIAAIGERIRAVNEKYQIVR